MKKIILTAITAALILTMLSSCGKDSDNGAGNNGANASAPAVTDPLTGETLPAGDEGEYEMVLVDSQIFDPQGNPVEQMPAADYSPINENAEVKHSDDITGLSDIIAGYQLCYNYDFSYDNTVSFEGGYYLVSDTAAITAYKAECAKYFEPNRYPPCFIEKDGSCFYKPVETDITLTMQEGYNGTGLNYSEENICELSYTDNTGSTHSIELTKYDEGFLISYITLE